ncbi:MAG: tetratricopeptide repeat protein [Prolixibacteraceae bacterium]|jgi:Ca-activated chloride channel homolog|nr:tetratricopeptide repeat protein [Prolixibacteraceae bacterium]MBT6763478.1 tetratricopeptide repeat protein [Prolixibacteraceae bacterium]MBT6999473.1 tetratricopeptide repeat protein [Prolixibacteraceae bacterium]MBT7396833.1 tetratricopeptide repeat protein [Prolixibacteraceae bacterium]
MKRIYILSLLLALSVSVFGQNERKFIRNGNKLFMEAVKDTTRLDTIRFSNAEIEYRKALNKKPADVKWNYNLADALYKQNRFEEAAGKFVEMEEKMETPEEKSRALHNLGNSQLMQEKLDESIESYKKALRNNPGDLDTKYNLAYAQMLKNQKEEQEQQNKDQNKDQDQDKDKEQDKDQNKDQQNQDQNKENQDQQDKQDQQQQNQNKDQQQQPQQNKISKENAEQLLQALQNDEREIQDKVKKAKAAKAKKTKVEKEW